MELIQNALSSLGNGCLHRIIGRRTHQAAPLEVQRVMRFYTEKKSVFAQTQDGVWQVKLRLKELTAGLDPEQFIQINQGEIVNLRFVRTMDLSLSGTIRLDMSNGTTCYVSRRCLPEFKSALKF